MHQGSSLDKKTPVHCCVFYTKFISNICPRIIQITLKQVITKFIFTNLISVWYYNLPECFFIRFVYIQQKYKKYKIVVYGQLKIFHISYKVTGVLEGSP